MKFESGDAAQYEQLEAPGTLAERLRHVRLLAENEWNVSSGFIAGLPGQTSRDLLKNFELARSLPLSGCRVSPFIPGEDTPLAKSPTANSDWTFNCVSALRLMRPDWVIPAVSAFNLAAPDGYRRGLRAGANLVTINLTPAEVRGDYVIYKRDRFIMTEERVLAAISAEGLAPSKQGLADFYRGKPAQRCRAEKISETASIHEGACCFLRQNLSAPPRPIASSSPARASSPRSALAGGSMPTGFAPGARAFRPVTLFDVSRQRSKIAAEVDLPSGTAATTNFLANTMRRLDRATRMLLHAAHEAWTQAGWEPAEDLPVVLGTTSGEMSLGEKYLRQAARSRRD